MTSARDVPVRTAAEAAPRALATRLVVGYVLLWTLEGAIRKWVPSTDVVFYLLRDASTLLGLFTLAVLRRTQPASRIGTAVWLLCATLIVHAAFVAALHDIPLTVVAVGTLSYLAPLLLLPLILLADRVAALRATCSIMLLAAPVEGALTVVQVLSPPDSVINQQVGSDAASLVTAASVVRATGTFSAPAGLTGWVAVCVAISLAALAAPRMVAGGRGLAWLGLLSALSIVILGGSRGAVLATGIVLVAFLGWLSTRGDPRLLLLSVGLASTTAVVVIVVALVLPGVVEAFLDRFATASATEDSSARILDQALGFLPLQAPLLGEGAGARSTVGIALGATGPWLELDSRRWVTELGVLGYAASVTRLLAAAGLAVLAAARWRRLSSSAVTATAALVPVLAYGSVNTNPSSQAAAAVLIVLVVLGLTGTASLGSVSGFEGRERSSGSRPPAPASVPGAVPPSRGGQSPQPRPTGAAALPAGPRGRPQERNGTRSTGGAPQ